MTAGPWSGQALPLAAQERLDGIRAGGAWGSALSVDEFAAISSVGFHPVGQVLGAAVFAVGDSGEEDCPVGEQSYAVRRQPGFALTGVGAIGSMRPLATVLYQARREALKRMLAECAHLGGHGVVGVDLFIGPFGNGCLEFRAIGTAVRASGWSREGRIFSSDLSGQDFAKLIADGWTPVGIAFGIAAGSRHDDWPGRGQTRWTVGNVEVPAYTELVTQMRRDARNELELDLIRMGADGVVVRQTAVDLRVRECPQQKTGRDLVAEVTIIGTAICSFGPSRRAAERPTLAVLSLGDRRLVTPDPALSVSLHGPPGAPAGQTSSASTHSTGKDSTEGER